MLEKASDFNVGPVAQRLEPTAHNDPLGRGRKKGKSTPEKPTGTRCGTNWLPIETAPRDGTLVIAGSMNHSNRAVVGWYEADDEERDLYGHAWRWDNRQIPNGAYAMVFNPHYFTHWMPLADPPARAALTDKET